MKMATEPTSYTAETCDGFKVSFTADTPTLFAGPIAGLTNVTSIDYLLLHQVALTSQTVTTDVFSSLLLSGTSFATTFTCIPTVLPSLATDQYYDLVFKRGSTSYQVPSFSTQPTEF
jgi:hypothetical protein